MKQAHIDRAFKIDDYSFDYVINLAAETEYGQSDEVSSIHFEANTIFSEEKECSF